MVMARWDPFREMRRMQQLMDRVWRSEAPELGAGAIEPWTIPMDVIENDSSVVVSASIPGVDPKDISVSVEDNILTISAEREEEHEAQEGRFLMRECSSGAFRRSLRLPNVIESERAESRYENGMLTVTFPKSEQKRARRIEVKGSEGQQAAPQVQQGQGAEAREQAA